jgi:phosphatidylserine/phosphatidylglycerophosphate/cardiolipin synthase-like enzyme
LKKFVKVLAFTFLAIFSSSVFAQSSKSDFQLVESVPIETSLGLEETERTLPVWLDMIKNAKESIEIECFYLSNEPNELLEQVLSEIKKAAKRQVTVRILFDERMRKTYPEPLGELNQIKNIFVQSVDYFNKTNGVMHAKYMIIDRKTVFIGSQNFDWRALNHIHEIGMRIMNEPFAQTIGLIFDLDWSIATSPKIQPITSYLKPLNFKIINSDNPITLFNNSKESIQIYPSFSPKNLIYPNMSWDEDEILNLINKAKSEVLIQLLSYTPKSGDNYYEKLDNALRQAAIRKVQVKIILSNWSSSESKLPFIKSLAVVPNIEIKFSSIPEWSGGFIPYARVEHCKYLLVDGKAGWLGTSNWSKDYFYSSRNLGIVFNGKSVAQLLKKMFMKSWESQYTEIVDPSKNYKPPKTGE